MGLSTELSILRQGIKQKWNIPLEARQRAVARIAGMLSDQDNEIVLEASKVLVSMDKVNVAHERNNAAKLHVNVTDMTDQELFSRLRELTESQPELRQRLLGQ